MVRLRVALWVPSERPLGLAVSSMLAVSVSPFSVPEAEERLSQEALLFADQLNPKVPEFHTGKIAFTALPSFAASISITW